MPTFTSETNPIDFNVYEKRARTEYLTWCSQVYDIIYKYLGRKKYVLNDLGCCYGQLLKEIIKRDQYEFIDYLGYDIDVKFIELARKFIDSSKFKIMDVEKEEPRITDVTVCSGLLEHVDNKKDLIKNILSTTKRMVIIRTYSGNMRIDKVQTNRDITPLPYNIDQIQDSWIQKHLYEYGFDHEVIKDIATNSSNRVEVHSGSGIYRNMFIHIGKK